MKLPDLIKTAVEKGDWNLVCAAYTAITGKPLAPPKPKESDFLNMEISEKLIQQLTGGGEYDTMPGYEDPENVAAREAANDYGSEEAEIAATVAVKKKDPLDFSVDRSNVVKKNSEGKIEARKESIALGQRNNIFHDDTNVDSHLLKDNEQMQKLYGNGKARASRDLLENVSQTGKTIGVQCSLCEKKQTVAVALAKGWHTDPDENAYRCNDCCTPSGRIKAERKQREKLTRGG
jgi:hypothetical protein